MVFGYISKLSKNEYQLIFTKHLSDLLNQFTYKIKQKVLKFFVKIFKYIYKLLCSWTSKVFKANLIRILSIRRKDICYIISFKLCGHTFTLMGGGVNSRHHLILFNLHVLFVLSVVMYTDCSFSVAKYTLTL